MLALLEWNTRCRLEHAIGQAHTIGINVRIISTLRSLDEQRALRDAWDACQDARARGNPLQIAALCIGVQPADFPGESSHNHGMGVDSAPVCTDEYARYRQTGILPTGGTSTPSPAQPTSPFDPLATPAISATCDAVPAQVLWAEWHRLLKEACLAVPLPQTDRPHSELREFRELRRAGSL